MRMWFDAGCVVVMTAAFCGCGGSTITAPETAPVSGTVTLHGKAAAGVRVHLHPQFDIGELPFLPSGETDREGRFTLSTTAPGDGAPPGEYVVTIEKPRVVSDRNQSGVEVEIDELKGKYSDPAKSAWKVMIAEGTNQLEPFALE